jgi:lipopolysaccharide/colanic/teichoic acid biosynthesis glycosyltransferase
LTDVVLALAGLILFSPLFLLVGVLVKLTSRGPVFFVQERAGRNGHPFRLCKFRSMVMGADRLRGELLHLNEVDGPAFKVTNDPRVTLVGRILRRLSLDELPQLWNILKGDMSIVGPRPLPVGEARACERWQRRRLSMRPGLTCLWQINGRSHIRRFDDWARLDLEYIDNWSLSLDMHILVKTVPAVILGRGAH